VKNPVSDFPSKIQQEFIGAVDRIAVFMLEKTEFDFKNGVISDQLGFLLIIMDFQHNIYS